MKYQTKKHMKEYVIKRAKNGAVAELTKIIKDGQLEQSCITAAEIKGTKGDTLVMLLDHGAIIDPENLDVSPLIGNPNNYEHLVKYFDPKKAKLVGLLTKAIKQRNDKAATLIWNAMSAKQQDSYRSRQFAQVDGPRWMYEWLYRWLVSNGIRPDFSQLAQGEWLMWRAHFEPVEADIRNILATYEFRTKQQFMSNAAFYLSGWGPKYIHNGLVYYVVKTIEGELFISLDYELIDEIPTRIVYKLCGRHVSERFECDESGISMSAKDVEYIRSIGKPYDMHLVDRENLYYELANEATIADMVYIAIHCNNLAALQMLLGMECAAGLDIPWFIAYDELFDYPKNTMFNECIEYLLVEYSGEPYWKAIAKYMNHIDGYTPSPIIAAQHYLIIKTEPEIAKYYKHMDAIEYVIKAVATKHATRRYNSVATAVSCILLDSMNQATDPTNRLDAPTIERVVEHIGKIGCKHLAKTGKLKDGTHYAYLAPTRSMFTRQDDTHEWKCDPERAYEVIRVASAPKSARTLNPH